MDKLRPSNFAHIKSRADIAANITQKDIFKGLTPHDIETLIPWAVDRVTLRNLRSYIDIIVKLFGHDWNIFNENFSLLDIACGSTDSEGFYPWLVLIISNLGAGRCVGIDKGHQPKELKDIYQHIVFNLALLSDNGLRDVAKLKDEKFDLITCTHTFTRYSPSLILRETADAKNVSLQTIQNRILTNIDDFLKPNGILFMDSLQGFHQGFRKSANGLRQIYK